MKVKKVKLLHHKKQSIVSFSDLHPQLHVTPPPPCPGVIPSIGAAQIREHHIARQLAREDISKVLTATSSMRANKVFAETHSGVSIPGYPSSRFPIFPRSEDPRHQH
jgi:hypothetical protein